MLLGISILLTVLAPVAPAQQASPAEPWLRRVDEALDRMIREPARPVEAVGRSEMGAVSDVPAAQAIERPHSTIERILTGHGLSADLIAVAKVESALDPNARSPKGAVGLWQLMPATARQFGISEDERTDPVRSTVAAARLLRYLYSRFDDWRLALAAYNAGEGAVERAMRAAGTRDFAELARRRLLPAETLDYVPKVDALRRIRAPVHGEDRGAAVIVWARPQ